MEQRYGPAPEQRYGPAPDNGHFEQLGQQLMRRMADRMEEEHQKELSVVRQKKQMLEKELRRMVLLMQQELLPRERQLHEMLENLNEAYRNANAHLHVSVGDGQNHSSVSNITQLMVGPMREAESELKTIQQLLGKSSPGSLNLQVSSPVGQPPLEPIAQAYSVGERVEGLYLNKWFDATIDAVLGPNQYLLAWDDRDTEHRVKSSAEIRRTENLFDAIDRNHDGRISPQEFRQAMAEPRTREDMFNALDRNHDGVISGREWAEAMGQNEQLPTQGSTTSPRAFGGGYVPLGSSQEYRPTSPLRQASPARQAPTSPGSLSQTVSPRLGYTGSGYTPPARIQSPRQQQAAAGSTVGTRHKLF